MHHRKSGKCTAAEEMSHQTTADNSWRCVVVRNRPEQWQLWNCDYRNRPIAYSVSRSDKLVTAHIYYVKQ